MQERVSQARSWLGLQSGAASIGLSVSAVVLVSCGCCGGVFAAALSSPSPTKQAAAATQSTVTQAPPAATATPALPTATAKPKAWVTVQHFTGNQNGKTATFSVKDGDKIVWSVKVGGEFGGYFSITTYSSDGSYGDLLATTTTPPAQSGTTIVHGDADIYLDIC